MATLYAKTKLYLEANGKTFDAEKDNFALRNDEDGRGDYVDTWNVDGLAKPTDEQLATYEEAGNAEDALSLVYSDRKMAYPRVEDQLDDIYHNGIAGWKATIKTTKDKYPKR